MPVNGRVAPTAAIAGSQNNLPDIILRHSGYAHAFVDPLASCEVDGMVAPRAGTVATDGEIRMESKSRLHGGTCFVRRSSWAKAATSAKCTKA